MTHRDTTDPFLRLLTGALFALSLLFASTALVGCDDDDGPMEEAGEEVDDALDDVRGE